MIAEPRMVEAGERKLVGMSMTTSLADNRNFELWRSFKPKLKGVLKSLNTEFYAVQKYPQGFRMEQFTPETPYEIWAAVESESLWSIPEGLTEFVVPAGWYAVFTYQGDAADFSPVARYIYLTWIPRSGYELDDRVHFAVMGEKYLPNDPRSEEEIWIPVKNSQ
jgi:AraC family transcriptional regulator